jgi:alkylation response protein AidB-like acyl-CoA dehydrogenase
MNHETVVSNAKEIADRVLAPAARQNDKEGRFSSEAVAAFGPSGLLGMMLPAEVGGSALGPRTFAAVVATLAEADASVAMVYLMHVSAAATIVAARPSAAVAPTLKEIAAGRHLSTLAFSEAGSRSHFWAPVSRARRNAAGVHITAKKSWVTSAGHAQSYVVSSLAPEATGPTDSTLYLIPTGARGLSVAGPWDGLGLRANASAPIAFDDCEARASAKAYRRCAPSLRRCRSTPMVSRRVSTMWSITSSGRGRQQCCACLKARPQQETWRSVSPRPRCGRAGAPRSPSI